MVSIWNFKVRVKTLLRFLFSATLLPFPLLSSLFFVFLLSATLLLFHFLPSIFFFFLLCSLLFFSLLFSFLVFPPFCHTSILSSPFYFLLFPHFILSSSLSCILLSFRLWKQNWVVVLLIARQCVPRDSHWSIDITLPRKKSKLKLNSYKVIGSIWKRWVLRGKSDSRMPLSPSRFVCWNTHWAT